MSGLVSLHAPLAGALDSSIAGTSADPTDGVPRDNRAIFKPVVFSPNDNCYVVIEDSDKYNPEFLTEKNHVEDFRNPPMQIFGGLNADTDAVEELYKKHSVCKPCPTCKTDIVTASMVKYCINSFLATKVTFMNEMYDVLKEAKGCDWNTFIEIISNDTRIGKSHMKVPGNDGMRGYAGYCFPKDTNALAWFARELLNTPFTQLETSIKINDKLRQTGNE